MDKEYIKNLLYAAVFSLLVIFLWMKLFPQQPIIPPVEPPAQQTTAVSPATPASPAAPLQTQPERQEVAAESPESAQLVVLENALYRATFTTYGARLSSLKLKEYPDKLNKDTVELVPGGTDPKDVARELPFELTFAAGTLGSRLNRVNFKIERSSSTEAVFSYTTADNLIVEKRFTLLPDKYALSCDLRVAGAPAASLNGTDIKMDWAPGLQDVELREAQAVWWEYLDKDGKLQTKQLARKDKTSYSSVIDECAWAGIRSTYFFVAVLNPPPATEQEQPALCDAELQVKGINSTLSYRLPKITIPESGEYRASFWLYAGPWNKAQFDAVTPSLAKAVYFGFWHPVVLGMLWFLNFCYRIIPNYGVGILLLTLLVRLLTWPLLHKSTVAQKRMMHLQPEIKKLQEQYKDSPAELQRRTMQFYKEKKINPFGGCIPMIVQMPVFIAMFVLLRNVFELRLAPFMGWITDLSEPEVIATLPFSIPLLGTDQVHLLPIIMSVTMYLSQKMTPTPGPPNDSQKFMMTLMPIMMTFFLYSFPSGLALYWTFSNILQIGQSILIRHPIESHEAEPASHAVDASSPERKQPRKRR